MIIRHNMHAPPVQVKKSAKPHSFIPDDLAFESDAVFVNQRKTRASKPSSAYVGVR